MSSTCMKRLLKERERISKDNAEYFLSWPDSDLRNFTAYIIGPSDSLYAHKFIKVAFHMPDNYPIKPPTVKFIQHLGERIHPNLYVDGKVCLSILGTWPGEPWAYSMTTESVLITIRSLLDNAPYKHEPNMADDAAFNDYVRYNTWTWLLLDYLEREQDPAAKAFLQGYVHKHGKEMIAELKEQSVRGRDQPQLNSPYNRHAPTRVDYGVLMTRLREAVAACPAPPAQEPQPAAERSSVSTTPTGKRSAETTVDEPQSCKKTKVEPEVVDLAGGG